MQGLRLLVSDSKVKHVTQNINQYFNTFYKYNVWFKFQDMLPKIYWEIDFFKNKIHYANLANKFDSKERDINIL